MSTFMLFMWISLIVILNARGEGNLSESLMNTESICQMYYSKTLPDCLADESLIHNRTIHCQQTEPMPCVIAVVNGHFANNETESLCILSGVIDAMENTIEKKSFVKQFEEQNSPMTTEMPMENASVEELKNHETSATSEQSNTGIGEPALDKQTTEALKEATTTTTVVMAAATTSNVIESSTTVVMEKAKTEQNTIDNVDEMPQADQPILETESNQEKPTEIEDNKIEASAVHAMHVDESVSPVREKTDAEPRMNTLEGVGNAEPKFKMLNCYGCQSVNDANCITKPTQTVSCKTTTELGANGCYTLLKDTQIERGCLDEMVAKHQWKQCQNQTNKICKVCHENLCNDENIFIAKHLFCHQCADSVNCDLEQVAKNATLCPRYEKDDACFLFADNKGKMVRGCKSNWELYKQCQAFGKERCLTCTTPDGCNSQPLLKEPKLYCSSCDSRSTIDNKNAHKCAWTQSKESLTNCHSKYAYYLKELCIMIYLPDIELSVRGCSLDIGACQPTYPWCRSCNTSGCNVGNLVTQRCLKCSSEYLTSCGTDIKELTAEHCNAEIQNFETRGCYVRWSLDSNLTTRGCISDLTAEGMDYCKANKHLCIFCPEDGCNKLLAPSSAEQKTILKLGFILLGLLYLL